MTLAPLINSQSIEITDISHGNGFTLVQLDEIRLIESYRYLIHVINFTDYETNIKIIERSILLAYNHSSDLMNEFSQLQREFHIPETNAVYLTCLEQDSNTYTD